MTARLQHRAYWLVLLLLVGLLAWSTAYPELPQFQGKAMAARLVLFPVGAVLVPVTWWLIARRHPGRPDVPWGASTLLALPFVLDLAGNALDLYESIERFDDVVHAVNPAIGVAGIALLLARRGVPRWSVWTMAFGLGCAAHIAFEVIEYLLLVEFGQVELGLTLRDTLSDLVSGVVGAAIGACVAWLARPGERDVTARRR